MSASITRIQNAVRRALSGAWNFLKRHPKKSVAVLVALAVGSFVLFGGSTVDAPAPEKSKLPTVTVATIASLSGSGSALVALGEVRSVTQAELRAQKTGEVTRVAATPGTFVSAGTILAEINPAAERAGVLSAQGTLAAAEAQLAKVRAGDRSEDKGSISAQAESAATALSASQESARAAYVQAYALAADAIYAQADDYFTNVYTVRPSFRISSANYDEKRALENERVALGEALEAWREITQTVISTSDLDQKLAEAQQELDRVAVFINTISTYISEQDISDDYLTASDKATQELQMAGARTSVASARSSVSGARQALAQAQSAALTTSFAENKTETGARPEDIAAALASVQQARGAVASAQAALERALIRTPIAGTVSSFSVSTGDFVSALESIAVVTNPGALEIEAFITGDALSRVDVGMPVRIGGQYDGVVTSRAPGLDPATKKARITVSAPEDAELVNGSFVELAIESNTTATTATSKEAMVPITAVKVLPRGFALFTVQDGKLVSIPISEGPIVGSMMLIRTPLEAGLTIVTDVRGLSEGDDVVVAE